MFIVRLLFILSLLHWFYLTDIFQRRPLHRRYLRLYKDYKFLFINIAIALSFLFCKGLFIPRGQVSISTLPMVFIILDRLLIKSSIIQNGQPFLFLQKGDSASIKGATSDYIYSFILLAGSLGLGLLSDYLWTTYY